MAVYWFIEYVKPIDYRLKEAFKDADYDSIALYYGYSIGTRFFVVVGLVLCYFGIKLEVF